MRHIYVGDVGDFGKYGLLRSLCGDTVPLGVVWYLTESEEHNNDGKHDGYLRLTSETKRSQFRDCDPVLYDQLKLIRENSRLDLAQIEQSSIFPASCKFHSNPIPHFVDRVNGKQASKQRWDERKRWHEEALTTVEQASWVFVDPDNGIIFDTPSEGIRPSHKHAYLYELRDYFARGQSVVAYHHLGRQAGGHELLVQSCLRKLSANGLDARAVHYNRGTGRVFFVLPQLERRAHAMDALNDFSRVWAQHARLVERAS